MPLVSTDKVHKKFQSYWIEYKRSEIQIVCKFLCDQNKLVFHKGDSLIVVKKNWSKICSFLTQWQGNN